MSVQVTMQGGFSAIIDDFDIRADYHNSQLFFEFGGLSNTPFSTRHKLAKIPVDLETYANVLGDGYQMLAQTAGLAGSPVDIGRCADNSRSYRIYDSHAPKRFYNYLVIEDSQGYTLFGFTSCHRFAGFFEIEEKGNQSYISVFINGENTLPQEWASVALESITVLHGRDLNHVYEQFARLIQTHHVPRGKLTAASPMGWCSWYTYYADVTEQDIEQNLAVMKSDFPHLEYLLIDDGYQAFMGDWLTPSNKFANGVKSLVGKIKKAGKKPAIWLAPFIVQKESKVFRQHRHWFVRHSNGVALKAEDVTYAGWRCTPWYILDTSLPEVQEHLTRVFKVMREEWGIELFKLDANYWGSLAGQRYQTGVTGVEAYRLGMEAIADGAGDALLLGCNAPMWPSLGLVDAMRVGDDVERSARRFEQIAKETFYRSWQHQRLWHIDPDCATLVSLANQTTERKYYEFHRNVLLASGGLLMSGDPLTELTPFAKTTLNKLAIRHRHSSEAAHFRSLSLNYASLKLSEKNDLHCLFNYQQPAREVTLTADYPVMWYDYWTGEQLCGEPTRYLEVTLETGLSSRAVLTAG